MENTTRLSDLPMAQENVSYQIQQMPSHPTIFHLQKDNEPPGLANNVVGSANNYMPLNIHPNPYGNSSPSVDSIPFPQNTVSMKEDGQQRANMQPKAGPPPMSQTTTLASLNTNTPEHPDSSVIPEFVPPQPQRLPSRDMPKDATRFSHDVEVQANFIPPPPPKRVKDYIKEYDEQEAVKIRDHEEAKKKVEWYEYLFRSYQTPVLILLLYYIFQMTAITRGMFFYLGKWSWLYQENGELTVYGMIVKSLLFTACYMLIHAIL